MSFKVQNFCGNKQRYKQITYCGLHHNHFLAIDGFDDYVANLAGDIGAAKIIYIWS